MRGNDWFWRPEQPLHFHFPTLKRDARLTLPGVFGYHLRIREIMKSSPPLSHRFAFTMVEMMVAVAIIGILAAMAFPAYNKLKFAAYDAVTVHNLQQLVNATITWASEHSDRIPSPDYSSVPEDKQPEYVGAGRWLDGVVFAELYVERGSEDGSGDSESGNISDPQTWDPTGASAPGATSGGHLKGTVFECKASVKRLHEIKDWYQHSFAMNANLQYDEINESSSDPWLTEKNLTKFELPQAMLYVDCIDSNIVMASDIGLLEDAAERRYAGKHVLAAFVDGNVQKIHPDRIPSGDPQTDHEASLFWRGVRERRN